MRAVHTLFLVVIVAVSSWFLPEAAQADTRRFDLQIGGLNRYYELAVPGGTNYPLLLVFHGGLGSPDGMKGISGLEAFSQRNGFAVAFMAGTGRGNFLVWNAGGCCASAMNNNVDELSYVRAVIAQITARYPVDTRRIYLAGFSNGGMLVQLLADRMAGEIAAAAIVGGPRFRPVPSGPPVPMLIMHAVNDPAAPFAGGYSSKGIVRKAMSAPFIPVQDGVQGWVNRDRCRAGQPQQFSGYRVIEYGGCAGGSRVTAIIVDSDEHAWFGGTRASGSAVNATAMIWGFLSGFSR